MTVQFVRGDLFRSSAQTITNPINCRGAMGGGLALEFRRRFPEMFQDCVQRCRRGEVRTGKPYVWQNQSGQAVLNFPTKDDWRDSSRIEHIEQGLRYLVGHYQEMGITSLALPALGCGLGGLGWGAVRPVMERELSRLGVPVEIFEP